MEEQTEIQKKARKSLSNVEGEVFRGHHHWDGGWGARIPIVAARLIFVSRRLIA